MEGGTCPLCVVLWVPALVHCVLRSHGASICSWFPEVQWHAFPDDWGGCLHSNVSQMNLSCCAWGTQVHPPPLLEGRLPQIYLQSDDVTFGGDDDEGKVERAMLLPSSQPLLSLPSQWLCAPPWARTNFSLLSKLLIPSCVIAPFFLQILLCKARYDQTRFLGDQWEMEQKVRYSSNYTFISLYFHDFSVYKMWK